MTPQARFRRLGWLAFLALLTGLYLALHFKAQAVHSDVVRAERRIVALEQEKLLLQTEFETRASQQQLAAWNRVDFGYAAPDAGQYLEGTRQLAALGASGPLGRGKPIRFAHSGAVEPAAPQSGADVEADIVADAPHGLHLATATLAAETMRAPLIAVAEIAAE